MKTVVLVLLGVFGVSFLACFAISTVVGIIKYKRGVKKDEKEEKN